MSTIIRRPLNVTEDKIPETRNRILGEMSNIYSVTSFNSATQSDKEMVQNNQPADPAIDTKYLKDEDDDKEEGKDAARRNNDSRCFLEQLARPLVLGIRQVVIKQPDDPVDYLIRWLLNYQSCQEGYENKKQIDKEKLAIEAKDDEEDEKRE